MEERAVVDRIEEGRLAVLLIGEDERELVVPVSRLPAGAREGTWIRLELAGDAVDWMEVDEAATGEARARIADKLRRLRERGRRRG